MNERNEFIDVELSVDLSETLRLFCEATGGAEAREEVIAAAIESYFHAPERVERAPGAVIPIRVVDADGGTGGGGSKSL